MRAFLSKFLTPPQPQAVAVGAAQSFIEGEFGGPTTEKETTLATSATFKSSCANDPDRVGLVIINLGIQAVYLGLDATVSATKGIFLAASGGSVSMNVRDDFTLSTREWFVISPSGASSIYVLETRRFSLTQSR